MKIALIRHAKTEQNYDNILQGHQNNLLSEDGRRHTLKLKEKLKDKHFDYCYMSPLIRCVETAILLIGDRVETIPDIRLKERTVGTFEGGPYDEYAKYDYWDLDKNLSDNEVEPIQDVFKRCEEFLNYIKEKHPDKSILIISHASIIRILRHLIVKDSLEEMLSKDIDNLYYEEFEL